VSETILDHGYIPEEHAPDPVTSHGDPTPPGKVAIWMFLASEVMFFIGVLGTYIILRSGSSHLFANHAAALSKPLAGVNTLVLILSSLTMALGVDAAQKNQRNRLLLCLGITILMAFTFMGIKYVEYKNKFTHHTIVAKDASGKFWLYDGHTNTTGDTTSLHGFRTTMPTDTRFSMRLVSEHDVHAAQSREEGKEAEPREYEIENASIVDDISYGPWKNIFYACYFTTTGIHGLHVVGGIVAIGLLWAQALRGKIFAAHTEYVGLYWHFVDLVWIFLFPLLYLI
jgi:cytochrome c oxidase subunit III